MKITLRILLNAHGFPTSFPRDLAAAPFTYGGLNIVHSHDLQGRENIKFLTLHVKRMDTTDKLMMINLKYIQMMIGTHQPFQHSDFNLCVHFLPKSWLKSIWEYTHSRVIFIDFSEDLSITSQRQHDKCIMDVINPHFCSNERLFINRIRIHLQLLTLADITDASGKRIHPNITNGISHRKSKLQWPNQILASKHLPLWKRACSIMQSNLHTHSLGYSMPTHQIWTWTTNHEQSILHNGVEFFTKITTRGRPSYAPCNHISTNTCTHPVDIYYERGKLRIIPIPITTIYHTPTLPDAYKACLPYHTSRHLNPFSTLGPYMGHKNI